MKINRNWAEETTKRVQWIQEILKDANAKGVVLGLSGGKDSAIVAALCKRATPNVLGVLMPSATSAARDAEDALAAAQAFDIQTVKAPLLADGVIAETVTHALKQVAGDLTDMAKANIKPRLRMTTVYAIGQSLGYLVAGTGNRSEAYMGYFTKWGDGAHDFDPIADLTVTELFQFGAYLGVPECILSKAPSAGLWPGQTDEQEMGVSYADLDRFLLTGEATPEVLAIIRRAHARSEHKRRAIPAYGI